MNNFKRILDDVSWVHYMVAGIGEVAMWPGKQKHYYRSPSTSFSILTTLVLSVYEAIYEATAWWFTIPDRPSYPGIATLSVAFSAITSYRKPPRISMAASGKYYRQIPVTISHDTVWIWSASILRGVLFFSIEIQCKGILTIPRGSASVLPVATSLSGNKV